MATHPSPWGSHHRMEPDEKARRLKQRFEAVSDRYHRAWYVRGRLLTSLRIALVAGLCVGITYAGLMSFGFGSPFLAIRHLASAPNCDAARAVGLAPANRGEPGYWRNHDADSDGRACEPWPG